MFDDHQYIFINPWGVMPPEEADLLRLKAETPELFEWLEVDGVEDHYSGNWLHLPDYLRNWDQLDQERKLLLSGFTRCSWKGNKFRKGIKEPDTVPEHVLLMIGSGCHANEVSGRSGSKLITGHFIRDGKFPDKKSNIRLIAPRAAANHGKGILTHYDVDSMFERHPAYHVIIHAPVTLRTVGEDAIHAQPEYAAFFSKVGALIDRWKRKGWIRGAIASHEIKCTSIIEGIFFPHTHLIAFTDDPHFVAGLPGDFSATDPAPLTNIQHVRNQIKYITAAASLVGPYRKELPGSPTLRREFNRRTVNAWSNLVYLMKAETDGILKTIRRTKIVGIPKRPKNGPNQ